jgi:cyclic beta-1,2-glucan synthetase
VTGDTGVLDERVPFLNARSMRPEEDAYYDLPQVSDDVGTLYDHCVRALDNGLRFGVHGLPLMGSGDWNDGMNLVGAQGKGESVWLALFLGDVLTQFSELARRRGASSVADKYTCEATRLRDNITAIGISALISTTGRRSGPPRTRSAGSTRCRKAGRSFPASARASAP